MSIAKPCIQYKVGFEPSSLTQVKLEAVVAGTVRSKKVPVFTASAGVEGLFHVIDQFNKAAGRLDFDAEDKWDQWEDVLDTTAQTKWANQIRGLTNAQKTNARFTREVTTFVNTYAGSDEARDILLDYIKSTECIKPRKEDCQVHASRIETLCLYANRLEGTRQELNADEIKQAVFSTFPKTWRNDYKKNRNLHNDSIGDIIEYMNLCKGIADDQMDSSGKNKKRKTEDGERIRGGNSSKNEGNRNTNKKVRVEDKDICPVHGGHKWGECSLNPRGKNWRGGRTEGGRFTQGGRGFG